MIRTFGSPSPRATLSRRASARTVRIWRRVPAGGRSGRKPPARRLRGGRDRRAAWVSPAPRPAPSSRACSTDSPPPSNSHRMRSRPRISTCRSTSRPSTPGTRIVTRPCAAPTSSMWRIGRRRTTSPRGFTRTASGYAATGTLTLRGVTKEVPLEFHFTSAPTGARLDGSATLDGWISAWARGEWKSTEMVRAYSR